MSSLSCFILSATEHETEGPDPSAPRPPPLTPRARVHEINNVKKGPCTAGPPFIQQSVCTDCPMRSDSPAGCERSTACSCNAGSTGPAGGPCIECVAGKYKDTSGDVACSDCAAGMYKDTVGFGPCKACPTGKRSLPGSTSLTNCTCGLGTYYTYSAQGGQCLACLAGVNDRVYV